jgi:tetratricopeptide (TPR) repeat protein
MKLATFFYGNSFNFDHGPREEDFLESIRIASDFARSGKREEALAACVAAADRKCTPEQKSYALELASGYARHLRKLDLADSLATRIPIDAVKKSAQMQSLLDSGKALQVIAQFAKEDIAKWPFWKRGDGLHHRGRAHTIAKNGEKAETDLSAALGFIGDLRTRETVLLVLAQNRETNLKDDSKALEAYEAILEGKTRLGGADEYSALLGIARIQTRRGQFDEALKTLERADPQNLKGVWKENIQKSIDAVKEARKSR